MMIDRTTLLAAAVLGLSACADTPDRTAADAPAARAANAPPSAADTSASSPMTVNPPLKGQSLPATPPTLPKSDPAPDDKSMPPGPVN